MSCHLCSQQLDEEENNRNIKTTRERVIEMRRTDARKKRKDCTNHKERKNEDK